MIIKFENCKKDVVTIDTLMGDVYSQIREELSVAVGKPMLVYIGEMNLLEVGEIGYSLEEIRDVANDKNFMFRNFMQHEIEKEFGDTENGRILLLLDRLDSMLNEKHKCNIFYYAVKNLDYNFYEIFATLKDEKYTVYFDIEEYAEEYFEFITGYNGNYDDYLFNSVDFTKMGKEHLKRGSEYDFEVDGYIYSLLV